MDFFLRMITSQLYGSMKFAKFVNKSFTFIFSLMTNQENIISVPLYDSQRFIRRDFKISSFKAAMNIMA